MDHASNTLSDGDMLVWNLLSTLLSVQEAEKDMYC